MDLQKVANLSQIIALIPGFYCAYGTYMLLQPTQQGKPAVSTEPGIVNIPGLLWSVGLFVGLFALGSLLRIIALSRAPRREVPQSGSGSLSSSVLAPYHGEDTGFRIESAMFGAPGIAPESVTAKVKKWVEKGNTSVPVSWQLLLDGRDPKPYAYKYLTVAVSATEMEGKELAIPVPPEAHRTKTPDDCLLPTAWKELTLQQVSYTPSAPGSTDHYRDKVRFVVTNSGKDVGIWCPLWESNHCCAN